MGIRAWESGAIDSQGRRKSQGEVPSGEGWLRRGRAQLGVGCSGVHWYHAQWWEKVFAGGALACCERGL